LRTEGGQQALHQVQGRNHIAREGALQRVGRQLRHTRIHLRVLVDGVVDQQVHPPEVIEHPIHCGVQ